MFLGSRLVSDPGAAEPGLGDSIRKVASYTKQSETGSIIALRFLDKEGQRAMISTVQDCRAVSAYLSHAWLARSDKWGEGTRV